MSTGEQVPANPGALRGLDAVLERVSDAVVALDRSWRYTYVNANAAALFGRTPVDLLGKHIWTEFPEGVGQPFHLAYERAMREQQPITLEDHYEPWDRWFENRIYPSEEGLTIFFHEITDQKRVERLLALQRTVLESIAFGAALRTSLDTLARGVEALAPGMSCSILLLERDTGTLHHGAAPSLPAGYVAVIDGARIGPSAGSCGTAAFLGEPVYVEDVAVDPRWRDYRHLALEHGLRACWSSPILDDERRVCATFAMYYRTPGLPGAWHRQIIEVATHVAAIALRSERARAALVATERRYEDLYENAPDGYLSVDARTRGIRACNATLLAMTGYSRSELLGRDVVELYDPASHDAARGAFERFRATGRAQVELRVRRKDASVFWAGVNVSAIRDASGAIVASRSIVRDITRQKEVEAELRDLSARVLRSQDDERRRLARELHDTTAQSLAALTMNVGSLLRRASEWDAASRALLEECGQLGDRCAQELRALSYLLHPPLLEELGLARALEAHVSGFARRSGLRITLELAHEPGALPRDVELALFRVVQESLANVHRHASGATVVVRLGREAERVVIEVEDDRAGARAPLDADRASGRSHGVGIPSMRERLRHLGGTLDVTFGRDRTVVRAEAPIATQP